MMGSSLLSLLFFLFLFHSLSSAAIPRTTIFRSELVSENPTTNEIQPTTFFEVTKPIDLPKARPCSTLVLQHDFGFTYGKPPVLAPYSPPPDCPPSTEFSKITLQWTAACKGRQFDRIFGVWLGGVELLRSCTAEPRATGIVWTVTKDITRYYSLLVINQTLAVYLGNLVDTTYTGIYHVNISINFYPSDEKPSFGVNNSGPRRARNGQWADLILPISRNLPLNDGLWFEVQNSTDTKIKPFEIPQNAYRAVLEVYVSFHENDEFWYTNFPNEYIYANNLTGVPGNGPFREVVVSLDGKQIGAVWPFTVVYTGGINPLLWRPISGIGSFNLPSWDIEMSPLLGTILDGKSHELGFSVTNALNIWYIDANLHVWLDEKSAKTEGKLLMQHVSPLRILLSSNFTGLNGTFLTTVGKSVQSVGWVKSSYGKITTKFVQKFDYTNTMLIGSNGNMQIINQTINFNDSIFLKLPSASVHSFKSFANFPLYLYSDYVDQGNGTFASLANITFGFDEKMVGDFGSETWISTLKNMQSAQGSILVKDNLVRSGLGSTQQVYKYRDNESCYFRNISSRNYTILHDKQSEACGRKKMSSLRFGGGKVWPFPARLI